MTGKPRTLYPSYKGLDVTGHVYGGLTVISRGEDKMRPNSSRSSGFQPVQAWIVKCNSCNNVYEIEAAQAYTRKTKACSKCYDGTMRARRGVLHHSYSGGLYVTGSFMAGIRSNAKGRNLVMELSVDFLDSLWLKQIGKCIYTGIDLKIGSYDEETTASVDRIDSSIGYLETNVQLVHKDINRLKTDFTEERFLELVGLISKNRGM